MNLGGFAGRILRVDLSSRLVRTEPLDPGFAEDFLGGLGISLRLARERIKPGIGALSAENPIIVGVGPLVGTNVPASSRVYAVSKFPSNGAIGWCGGGGMTFGCLLKCAGYDHVVIEGRAAEAVILRILDDHVEIADARDFWGKGVEETCEALWARFGRPAGVICIGQAGENLVSFSMAYIDGFSTLGRGGFGAVMGSKNLKAIFVQGTKGVSVSHRKHYKELLQGLMGRIRDYPYLKEWQEMGLMKSLEVVPPELYRRIKKRRVACVSCPLGDKDIVEIPQGPHAGQIICSTSAVNLFTPSSMGLRDPWEAARIVSVLDGLGMDMFEFFAVLGFARTLLDNSIIPRSEAEPDILLDSLPSLEAWAGKISRREGLGQILAEGLNGLVQEFGERARRCAPPMVKGMLPYVGPQAPLRWSLLGTMELGQLLEPRGPHVATSGSPTYFARRPLEVFPKHLTRMGVPPEALEGILPGLETGQAQIRVGRLLKYSHRWFTILACLGICARAQVNRFYDAGLCARLYEAVTGLVTPLEELRFKADRVWTLLRMLNVREGFHRAQDSPPAQWFGLEGFKDYLSDKPLSPQEVEAMVDDYYREQGWDPRTGAPTRERLVELGIADL
jgi:aldehyde:ferredoxin oxidoreductase